jgi:hypothetical protein
LGFLRIIRRFSIGIVGQETNNNRDELAKSFYEELKTDSVTVALKVQNRLRKEHSLKYLRTYFADSSLTQVSKTFTLHFIYGVVFRTGSMFEARTVVLDQLKNSGALRYFKNPELKRLIGDLSISIRDINDRQELESYYMRERIQPIMTNHLDFEFEDKLFDGGKDVFDKVARYETSHEVIPFTLNHVERIDRSRIVGELAYFEINAMQSTRTVPIKKYIEVNAALLTELRREFDLK